MKKLYSDVEMEIVDLTGNDIITESGNQKEEEPDEPGWGDSAIW